MDILRGDVFWIEPEALSPAIPGAAPHPHVVLQADVLNRSRIPTVVVCALTTNMSRAHEPGNVLLDVGEAGLPKRSIAVVSQVSTVDKSRLGERLGAVSEERVAQILAGLEFQQRAFFAR